MTIDHFNFQSDLENSSLHIVPLNGLNNYPKLFNDISVHKEKKDNKYFQEDFTNNGKLDITKLYKSQNEVWNHINAADELIGNTISETDVIFEYHNKHK